MAAKNYTEILALVNAGNQMGLSNTIKRDYGIPLDFTSVQPSYDEAVVYAATNTKAYVGQPLSVGGKLYIINDVAADAKHKVGEVEYDNYLVEVGSATEGDGVTIDLEEGVLTLHGFEGALSGYLPRKAEDGSLEWVPISAVVQGDGNKITTLTSEDGSVTITKKTDTDDSLVYDLSVTHPDAPEYAIAKDERAEGATETTYHLTKDGENVDVAIVVPDAYNDTALAGRVKAVEDNKANAADVYTKDEVDTAIDNAVTGILGEGIDEAYNTLKEIQDILEGTDGEAIDGLIETVAANKQAIETLNGAGEGSVDKKIADAMDAHEEAADGKYATKQELTDHSNTMDGKLVEYAKTADVNTELAKKIESATIAHAVAADPEHEIEAIPEGVTKEGTTLKIVIDAPTRSETAQMIADKVADVTGGESAAAVKLLVEAEVERSTAKDEAHDAALAILNGEATVAGSVAEAKALAQKGVDDAKKANDDLAALIAGDIATQAGDITAIKGRLTTLETAKGDHETRIGVVEGKVTALEGEDAKINETLGTIAGQITALQGEDSRLIGLINANTTEIGKKANAADVYSKDEVNATVAGINEELAKKLVAADLSDYAKSADIAATYSTIAALEAIYKAGEGEVAATGLLAEEIARAKAAEQKIADELALLTNNPTEELDSVLELIEHVTEHGTAVAGIITRLDGHDTALENLEDRIEALEDKPEYVLPAATVEALGGIKSAADVEGKAVANAVYVDATSGIGSVKAISTDMLVQGANELVLNGGTAKGAQA